MWFARLFGIIPLGIGLSVLGLLWLTPFNEFGSPPLFFRIFGSFIALPFLFIGGALLAAKRSALKNASFRVGAAPPSLDSAAGSVGYQCAHCGAALDKEADVSPHGDVKCAHCGRWFNIHKG